ncbi:MAG: methyltransferase domain-containing protein, partial [Candidatus Saccharimonadales bacterium]
MLPPKLALMMVNLGVGGSGERKSGADSSTGPAMASNTPLRILDPFCGTGVILQEASLRGFAIYGTDLADKMIDFSRTNIEWLADSHSLDLDATIDQGDATDTTWQQPIDAIVCESYLGQPFSAPPSPTKLDQVRKTTNNIITAFLENVAEQIPAGTPLCIAIPAWKSTNNDFTHLPLIGNLDKLGYSRYEFSNVKNDELLYYREDQVVARELLVLIKN